VTLTNFVDADITALAAPMKVGILGTVTPEGLPHLTLISSLQPRSATEVMWGQFTEGLSKGYIRDNPKTGFLIMTLDKNVWRGKALFKGTATTGPEHEMYNRVPMFRYNAYFGIHTVYFMDLVELTGRTPLPMNRVIFAAVETLLGRTLALRRSHTTVLNAWTRRFLNGLSNLKFVGYVDADGYPVIVPCIQAQARDAETIVFAPAAFGAELAAIPQGAPLALFGMSLNMEDVLVRGVYQGMHRVGGVRCGVMRIDWVYNAMPPSPEVIYPRRPLTPVREF
jgi:hypothetical protein